jgi:2-methylcitrate dehydratase PrpD
MAGHTLIEHHLQRLIERLTQPGRERPQQVDTQARWLVLDTLGCAIAGARAPTVRAWLDGQHLRADPFATASPGPGGPSSGAAMAFAMAACWDEACEGHARAHGRPGVAALAAIWPWVHQLNWGQLLHALVLGYEVGARMGALLRIAPGMHVDGNWPSLGGAAAAAGALQLNAQQTLTAIHIAACQLPTSLYRPIQTGDTARNTYLGHAAMLGQMAAQAAAAGISAPANAIETHLQVAYQKPAPTGWEGSDDFEILSAYFKPYAAVRHVHYGAHAALGLRAQFDLDMLAHIDLWVYQEAQTYCGVRQPQTPLQAQFSLSFGVAAMLRWGHLNSTVYTSPEFEDARVHQLEKKVTIHVHDEWTQKQWRRAKLRLTLVDGRVLENTCQAVMGDADMPWREQDLKDKFITNCQGSLSPARSQMLAEHVLHAPDQAPIFPR